MPSYRETIEDIVRQGLKSQTHPVQGYVPKGGITGATFARWQAGEVRVPNPHGGSDPGQPGYISYFNIPLPRGLNGFFDAFVEMVAQREVGVLVGFRGGNMSFPYIIQFLRLAPEDTPPHTRERQGSVGAKFNTKRSPAPPSAGALGDLITEFRQGKSASGDGSLFYEGPLAGMGEPSEAAKAKVATREAELRKEINERFKDLLPR